MIYMLDTADLKSIRSGIDIFPISGVTTNPSILAATGKLFYDVLLEIRNIIGADKMLHCQVLGKTAEVIVEEARKIKELLGENTYIKIPVFAEGIKAIKFLKTVNFNITATAIFTPQQALIAAEAGAEYVAPYINRYEDICGDSSLLIKEMRTVLDIGGHSTVKILGASFKNIEQVNKTILAGAKSVTLNYEIMERLLYHPYTDFSIEKFNTDWEKAYGSKDMRNC